jgi:hypothetical protein
MVPENKQKIEDTNKLTTLAFKMFPILHNTLLATPKLKFYYGAFANFCGPTNPANTIFMGPHSNFTLEEFVLLRSLPNSNFIPGALPILGAHWDLLGFKGTKLNLTLGHLSVWGGSQTQILLRGFCPFWGPLGHFGE